MPLLVEWSTGYSGFFLQLQPRDTQRVHSHTGSRAVLLNPHQFLGPQTRQTDLFSKARAVISLSDYPVNHISIYLFQILDSYK